MLRLVAGLAPHHRGSAMCDCTAVARDPLTIAFHVELLQERRETGEPRVIGQHRERRQPDEIDAPHPEQRHQNRQILAEGRLAEMPIHRVRAGEQRLEVRRADGDRERHADRRPHRVAPAHPIPHPKTLVGVDAEGVHRGSIDGHRRKMRRHRRLAQPPGDPGTRRARIGESFLGGEGLGADDEQRSRRVCGLQKIGERTAIDIGHEVHRGQAVRPIARPAPEMPQRLRGHGRPEVRAADADVDDRVEAAAPANGLRERQHARALGEHLGLDRSAADLRPPRLTQRDMQRRPALGGVDDLAAEHRRDGVRQACGIGERVERRQR